MHKCLIAIFIGAACLVGYRVAADSYSTDATMWLQEAEGTLQVEVRVSRLTEQGGKVVEELIEAPRITTAPGVPASLHCGPKPGDSSFTNRENVSVEVSWPYPKESGVAFCAVTVSWGNVVVSKSRLQLRVEGPGRKPLVIAAQDVDPKSVQVVEEKPLHFVLVEFRGKSKDEVKKLALENFGNRVQVRDAEKRVTEAGVAGGRYRETGIVLHYKVKAEADHAAGVLRGQ